MGISQKAAPGMHGSRQMNRVRPLEFDRDRETEPSRGPAKRLVFPGPGTEQKTQLTLDSALGDQILALYDEYRPRLFRYIRSMNLSRDQVEEVIQETFLKLTTQLMEAEDIENVQGWVVRVAHNVAVDVLRRNGRDASGGTDLTFVFESRVDPTPNPEEAYSRKEQISRMEIALSTFNDQQRQCFNLRAQGFRYKDIGTVFGISEQRAAFVVKQVAVRLAAICD